MPKLTMGTEWSKTEAEQEFLESTDLEVAMTDDQWNSAVNYYNNIDYPTWEDMIDAVAFAVGAVFDPDGNWIIREAK